LNAALVRRVLATDWRVNPTASDAVDFEDVHGSPKAGLDCGRDI
jgi:hypothetical protein